MEDLNEIVLFDGVCNLCNNTVQFIIRKEKKPHLKFATLQSATGKKLIEKYNVHQDNSGSVIYIKNGKAYTKTSAALRLTKRLRGLYPMLSLFLILPTFSRDWLYNLISKNRYKWWGKSESCQTPTSELRKRFIDL